MKAHPSASAPFGTDDIMRLHATAAANESTRSDRTEPNAALAKLLQAAGGLDTMPPVSPVVLSGTVRLIETALLGVTGVIAAVAFRFPNLLVSSGIVVLVSLIVATLWRFLRLNSLQVLRAPRSALPRQIAVLGGLCLAAAVLLGLTGYGGPASAMWLSAWFGSAAFVLLVERLLVARFVGSLTRRGRLERRTVVVGGGKPGEDLLDALARQADPDLRIYGVFDDRNDARSPLILAGYPKLGNVSDLVDVARRTRIDLILFTLPITAEERLLQMLKKLWVLPTDIRLAAHRSGLRFRPQAYSYVGDVPVLDMFDKPIADWDIVIKAIFDRVVGTLALIVLSPVLLLTALAVKLDSRGPILFRQMRHGFNNEAIQVLKFRSLYADQTDFTAAKAVTKNDPRVTRVGRFIRKTSIDELPQLFNVVFKGNLSLVGPRPHAVHAHLANKGYDDVVDGYFARHKVKPGITGWAQVNGWRGETDTPVKIQKRVEHDLAYIENWSILFDAYILLITPLALTRTENAY